MGSKNGLHSIGGWGSGGFREKKQGRRTSEEGPGLRALEIGRWSYRPRICDCFHGARGEGNYVHGKQGSGISPVVQAGGLRLPAATCGGANCLRLGERAVTASHPSLAKSEGWGSRKVSSFDSLIEN